MNSIDMEWKSVIFAIIIAIWEKKVIMKDILHNAY